MASCGSEGTDQVYCLKLNFALCLSVCQENGFIEGDDPLPGCQHESEDENVSSKFPDLDILLSFTFHSVNGG